MARSISFDSYVRATLALKCFVPVCEVIGCSEEGGASMVGDDPLASVVRNLTDAWAPKGCAASSPSQLELAGFHYVCEGAAAKLYPSMNDASIPSSLKTHVVLLSLSVGLV